MPLMTRLLRNQGPFLVKAHDGKCMWPVCLLVLSLPSAVSSSLDIYGEPWGPPSGGQPLNRIQGDYAPSHHIQQCISLLRTLFKPGWGLGACDVCNVLKNHRSLEFFPPASSLGLLVSNSQHAAFLYEKLEFGHLEG